ncbi:MAG: LysR family substrate-binding domain-containing protein [Burkholderiales bacterium]|nr:LysR family substrate-binding domain-containing protein [Burkholderiales bacterium]
MRLFIRANRRIALSEAGEAFLAQARAALHHADLAGKAARRAARGETGTVIIGYVSSALAERPFTGALAAFRASYPDVVIEMHLRLAATHIEAVQSQTVDVSVTRGPIPLLPEDCEHFVLARQPIVVALPKTHPLRRSASIPLAALAQDTLLQPEDPPGIGLADTLRQIMARARFTPRRTMLVNEMTSTLGLVAAGMGVALLPASARALRMPGVAFCPLEADEIASELVAVHRRFERAPAVQALLLGLRAQARVVG